MRHAQIPTNFIMRLQQDIDELDRMVDTDAQKDKIRSQIRLIYREVAAMEADYARLAQDHADLHKAHTELQEMHSDFKVKAAEEKASLVRRNSYIQSQQRPRGNAEFS